MARLERCYNIADFGRAAKQRLPKSLFDYIEGASDDEETCRANEAGFRNHQLAPRYLTDITQIDLGCSVFGRQLEWPLILAPTGMNRMFHPDGEKAVARQAARTGACYSLSAMATESIETIAQTSNGPKIFQLYLMADEQLNLESIDRARAAGFDAICLTVDTITAGNRERDLRSGLTVPPQLTLASLIDFAVHPKWCAQYVLGGKFSLPNITSNASGNISTLAAFFASEMESNITWSRVEKLITYWGKPFAIKGLQTVADAKLAVSAGASAMILSNHGGRQLDGGAATIDLLPEIVDAVGDKIEVIIDGGFRRGSHIVKAMALGATACMTGRPYLYALSAFGEKGVARALDLLKKETERAMMLTGCARISGLNREFIR